MWPASLSPLRKELEEKELGVGRKGWFSGTDENRDGW